jgi:hypothetical protein
LSLSAVSISGYDRAKIQAKRNDATSQILQHHWRDNEDALLRQQIKGARMPWKQLFQGFQDRKMAEIRSLVRSLRKLDATNDSEKNIGEKQPLIKTRKVIKKFERVCLIEKLISALQSRKTDFSGISSKGSENGSKIRRCERQIRNGTIRFVF